MNYTTDLHDIDSSALSLAHAGKARTRGIIEDPKLLDFRGLGAVIQDAGTDSIALIESELGRLTRAELDRRMSLCRVRFGTAAELETVPADPVRLDYWLCNVEYTRRNIPPIFRNPVEPNTDVREQTCDAFAIDLHWLVAKYPNHTTSGKWRGLWKPGQFHSAAKWISGSYPKNQPYWFVRGLSLDDDQQREMHLIKFDRYRSEFARLSVELDEIRLRLRLCYEEIAKDPRHRSKDPKATINRRADIWFCTSLDNWKKPQFQRIARLYEARTGDPISRQLVGKTIDLIRRDIPETKLIRNRPGPQKRQV